jgi:hypothetical protein
MKLPVLSSSCLIFAGMRRNREHRSNIAVTLHSTLKITQQDGRKGGILLKD